MNYVEVSQSNQSQAQDLWLRVGLVEKLRPCPRWNVVPTGECESQRGGQQCELDMTAVFLSIGMY